MTVEADSLHGKQVLLANSNRLMLETTMRVHEGYPSKNANAEEPAQLENIHRSPYAQPTSSSSEDASKQMVVGDRILEISPTGEVIEQWNLLDLLDTERRTYHNHIPSDAEIYPPTPKKGLAKAWSRAKAVAFDQLNDTLIVSLMHQDAVAGIDKSTGKLKWLLGDPSGWKTPWSDKLLKPVGESFSWFYYPSDLSLIGSGEILLLDNGSYRAIPPAEPKSLAQADPRVMALSVDEEAMTVELKASSSLPMLQYGESYHNWLALQMLSIAELKGSDMFLSSDGFAGTVSSVDLSNTASQELFSFHTTAMSKRQWGIADLITTTNLIPPSEYVPSDESTSKLPVNPSDHAVERRVVDQPDNADPSLPTYTIMGNWQLLLGTDEATPKQSLELIQNDRLIEGSLAGHPVIAFVKGNTFNMIVRRDNGEGRVRFRYRGVISNSFDYIRGTVSIDQDGTDIASLNWSAYRE